MTYVTYVLFLMVFVVLSLLVATYLGYRLHGKTYAEITEGLYALGMAFVLCVLIFGVGPTDWMVPMKDSLWLLLILVSIVVATWGYNYALRACAHFGEELNYSPETRKARRQRRDYAITGIITAEQVARALRQAKLEEQQKAVEHQENPAN